MAILLNESEQVAALFEVISVRNDWVFSRIAFQYYVSKDNDFATWAEGFLDIYKADLKRFVQELAAFVEQEQEQQEFRFEPVAEPSFEVRIQVGPSGQRGMVVASVALDLKRVLEITIPTSYRDDRITLQLTTDGDRLHKFAEQFSIEASRIWRSS